MNDYTEAVQLKNKIESVNKLHKWINNIYPVLFKDMEKGYQTKDNGEFYKMYHERFRELVDNAPMRAHVKPDKYTQGIILKADITFQVSEFSCAYFGHSIYINNQYKFEPLKIYKIADVNKARQKKSDIETKIRELNTKIRNLDTLEG